MNNAVIIGRLTKDPETRYTGGQMAVCNFTVAVDRITKGEKTADFIKCAAFGKLAENVQMFTHKGDRVGVLGSISTGSYTDKNGATVYTTEIIADRVEFLEKKTPVNIPDDMPF